MHPSDHQADGWLAQLRDGGPPQRAEARQQLAAIFALRGLQNGRLRKRRPVPVALTALPGGRERVPCGLSRDGGRPAAPGRDRPAGTGRAVHASASATDARAVRLTSARRLSATTAGWIPTAIRGLPPASTRRVSDSRAAGWPRASGSASGVSVNVWLTRAQAPRIPTHPPCADRLLGGGCGSRTRRSGRLSHQPGHVGFLRGSGCLARDGARRAIGSAAHTQGTGRPTR
jgi:hypothetical protein